MTTRALLLASLILAAGCVSLPDMREKALLFPVAPVRFDHTIARHEWIDTARNRTVPVTIYSPAGTPGRFPVVLVSHGIGEDRDSYRYLGVALASRGFLAVHITHAGTDRAMLERGYLHLYRATKEPANWVARTLDVSFVLDRLDDVPNADMDRVAVVGHSAGAFTAFAVAGLRLSDGAAPRDPRVKVIVPMSMPRLDGVVAQGGYDGIAIPALNITGTRDSSLIYRTRPRHRRIPFESTSATAQYLVTMEGVTHNSFSNPTDRNHEAIAALTIAFLRGFLLHEGDVRAWFDEAGRGAALGVALTVEKK